MFVFLYCVSVCSSMAMAGLRWGISLVGGISLVDFFIFFSNIVRIYSCILLAHDFLFAFVRGVGRINNTVQELESVSGIYHA